VLALAALTAALVWALPAGAESSKVRTTKITVLAGKPTEFGFKLSKTKVPKGVVIFTVKNMGAIPHDFKIAGKKTKTLNAGKSATLRVSFTKTGKSAYLCTLPSHAVAGMKGTLTITK
jgi:uncharacterized cupredoxin-like copper-binding protein